jgi:integrase
MATLIKRGEFYQAKIRRIGLPILSRTFTTKTDAQTWIRDTEHKIDRGLLTDTRKASATTLHELLSLYINDRLPKLKNADKDIYALQALQRDQLSRLSLANLTPMALTIYRDKKLGEGKSGATVTRALALVSAVINFGRKDLLIEMNNPVSAIRRPKIERGRDRRLSDEEEGRLLYELKSHSLENDRDDGKKYRSGCLNEWALPFVQFALATAMRKGEILKLKWTDVDIDRRVARLWDTKNGEDRAVPLSTKAVEILKVLPPKDEDDQTDYVFRTTSESMKKCFERARQRALLDDLRFHDLRHEATSRMANKLPNVVELSAVTGHKTLAMLGRYYHPRAEELALKLG